MDRNQIKERLELALKPAKPPALEEVLEQVSTRGVLRGPVDWVFPAWMLYVEYATQKIAETFPLSEEEKRQLLDFRDAMKRLLLEAWVQAKEKLTALYKAVAEGMYRVEGDKIYAPNGTWMYVRKGFTSHIIIRGVGASTYFPNILKLPRERLELLQLGWRASDEGNGKSRPFMGTAQPWQVFAWAAARYGKLHIYIASVNLTREGISIQVYSKTKSWRQRWNKNEAIDLVTSHLKRGEWAPLLTAWLGDGSVDRKKVLHSDYKIVVAAKEPWRLSNIVSKDRAIVATGKEAFVKLREAAGVYGMLLDLLRAHKWVIVKLATDDNFRAAYKLKTRKRSIDRLREAYRQNNGEIPTAQGLQRNVAKRRREKPRKDTIAVADIKMTLQLMKGKTILLIARRYVCDVGRALAIAERLESAGLKPNVVPSDSCYMVYIATADLLRLAERDGEIRRAIALYLAEKAKNGTPRQREIAEELLKRIPFFNQCLSAPSKLAALTQNSQSPHVCAQVGISIVASTATWH